MEFSEQHMYWVGPRKSDIYGIENMFSGYITYFGGVSLSGKILPNQSNNNPRINHNTEEYSSRAKEFFLELTKKAIEADESAIFLWYGKIFPALPDEVIRRSPYQNNCNLLRTLSNKMTMRSVLSANHSVVPCTLMFGRDCSYGNLKKRFTQSNSFVVQRIGGSGGMGTFLLSSAAEIHLPGMLQNEACLVSPYFSDAIPLNIHVIISKNKVIPLSPSVQILNVGTLGQILYSGADFSAANELSTSAKSKLMESTLSIGHTIQRLGYRGVAGIDYLYRKGCEPMFVEINPRFQASTVALNQDHLKNTLPSIQELHVASFVNNDTILSLKKTIAKTSMYISTCDGMHVPDYQPPGEHISSPPTVHNNAFLATQISHVVLSDNISKDTTYDYGAQGQRTIYGGRIISSLYSPPLTVNHCVTRAHSKTTWLPDSWDLSTIGDMAKLKFDLFSLGTKFSQSALTVLSSIRRSMTIRDGIAGGLDIIIGKLIYINVPIKERFSLLSPYELDWNSEIGFHIKYKGTPLCEVQVVPQPSFVGKKTSLGNRMELVGQLFTDRLGIYPFHGCKYNSTKGTGCKFCEIQYNEYARANIGDIVEVVNYCEKDPASLMKHILVSGGTPRNGERNYLLEVVSAIRNITEKKYTK